jgi:hypothetical protein
MLAGDRNTLSLSATRAPRRFGLCRLVSHFAADGYACAANVQCDGGQPTSPEVHAMGG